LCLHQPGLDLMHLFPSAANILPGEQARHANAPGWLPASQAHEVHWDLAGQAQAVGFHIKRQSEQSAIRASGQMSVHAGHARHTAAQTMQRTRSSITPAPVIQ